MLPWHPASGPVCARALHAKELWTADALDNAAVDDTDDGICSVTPWAGCSRTPLYLAFTARGGISIKKKKKKDLAEKPENLVVGPVPGSVAITSVSGLQRQRRRRRM